MEKFQEAMDDYHDELVKYIDDLAVKLGVSSSVAGDIWYLRTRSRWTQRAEDELVRMAKAGEPMPNINEWPADDSLLRNIPRH